MRGSDVDRLSGFRIDPPAENASAWKHKGVRAVLAQNREFQVAIEWCARYGLPIHGEAIGPIAVRALDLDHCNLRNADCQHVIERANGNR
jgi:hypothetical protein